jgi:transcriptional regulator with XRE-family HTH domain
MSFNKHRNYLSLNTKRLRKNKGVSQEKLADEAGIDRTLVSKIEGGLGNPTLAIMVKLAGALGVGICDLLGPFTEV